MKKTSAVIALVLVMIMSACNSSSSPSSTPTHVQPVSPSEAAVSSISGTAESTETAIELARIHKRTSGTCLSANINCAGAPATFGETYSDCALGSFDIDGSIAYDFSDETGCDTALTSPGSLADGENITRLLNLRVTGPSELDISVSSSASGFAQQVSGGTSVSCGTGGCVDNRTITINGEHWTGAVNGSTLFDFYVKLNGCCCFGRGSQPGYFERDCDSSIQLDSGSGHCKLQRPS